MPDYFAACGVRENHKNYALAIFILAALVVVLTLTILYMKRRAFRKPASNQGTEEGYEVHMDEKIVSSS